MSKVKNLNLEKVKETIKLNPSASYSELAKVLDCSKSTIYYFIQKLF
jgi:predicted transcriptional regulator